MTKFFPSSTTSFQKLFSVNCSQDMKFVHAARHGRKCQYLRCIGQKWSMNQMADGHLCLGLNGRWSFGAGLNDQVGHLRLVTSPGLKLPTQSQMANGNLKVPDLKVCVQNMKLFFT